MTVAQITPFDGKVALWHWRGAAVAENTIEDLVRTIKQWSPYVTQVWVKTSDGSDWMSQYDTKPSMAISGPASIARWVQVLEANGMEFHAWCVPKGQNIEAEADIITQTCQVPGVRSMIMDIEPYAGFWQAGSAPIRPFMTRIRRGVGGKFHIGMSMDPRRQHYNTIFPSEWKPFINSVHPQTYWASFQRPIQEVIDEVYQVWGNYGLPIFPALQGNAPAAEITQARNYAMQQYKAAGLSWWRFGVIGSSQFPAINQPMKPGPVTPPPPTAPPPGGGGFGQEIVVTPDNDPRFTFGTYNGQPPSQVFQTFPGTWGWQVRYKPTVATQTQAWALWTPGITRSGWYEISVFVPARHATTASARYRLYGAVGQPSLLQININQSAYRNLWVPLGVYQLNANDGRSGVVFLNDLTSESNQEIAFDAVRWREVVGTNPSTQYLADGYDVPMGTSTERADTQIWPGNWFDATGFAVRYFMGQPAEAYHTGADLNLNQPFWDADAHSPVYAAASGVVTFAGRLTGWGNVVVIRHDPLVTNGKVMYGRYAHVEQIVVRVGDRVQRGQQVANVGNAEGAFPYHLHFDLSQTNILETDPFDWPRLDLNRLLANYSNPQEFVRSNRPARR
ncbi:MAG: peptidoglycan DD-metalloendopeptidase family protein [Chloroflexi bacterium]|nr:peptidoglycan DD-metalloendopeptidase family protein [Chloroflexota bacterium]